MNKTPDYESGNLGLSPKGATIPASSNGQDASLLSLKSQFKSGGGGHFLNYMEYMNLTFQHLSWRAYMDASLRQIWLHCTIPVDRWLHDVMENIPQS